MNTEERYVIGVDFGTLSARALVVRVRDGFHAGTGELAYPHGVLSDRLVSTGERLPADWALQVPGDYRVALTASVRAAIADSGVSPHDVIGIGIDITSSTILPVTADGTPLSELPEFAGDKHAYLKLWKHHGAQPQADRLCALATERGEAWLARYGGRISSEGALPKALELLESAPHVAEAMTYYVEAADWIVWYLSGRLLRNSSSAGYKFLVQDGTFPSADFLDALHPGFADLVAGKLGGEIGQLGHPAGGLTEAAASDLGLPAGITVAVANVDAHVAAPAAQAVEPGQLIAIMGTSSCHIVNAAELHDVPGTIGVVDGGVVDGLWGYECGQSGVGDVFAWFTSTCVPPSYHEEAARRELSVHELLTELAAEQQVGEHGLVALDWLNGNRSVLVDQQLTGLILGLTLSTRPEDIYRALVEATAFGARIIVDTFRDSGVAITEFIVSGGLKKNTLLMQIYADVLEMPLSVATSSQGPALGSAIQAAVAAGAYPGVTAASAAMGSRERDVFLPDPERVAAYRVLFDEYATLHDYFGRGANNAMRRLGDLRRRSRG